MKQKSCDSDEDKNTVDGLQRRACNSSNSPPQRDDKGECSRYNSTYHSVAFDYVKHDNFYISIGKKLHVPFVVWLTIVFLDVGREWPHT